jgi:hypothetical protein
MGKKVMVIGSTYGMSEEEAARLDLYISTLKELGVRSGYSLQSSHVFDYTHFHKVHFVEFEGTDEIQVFCRRNDPKDFFFLAGIVCGQTRVPVKVLEEFSDRDAGLYKKLKKRERMNNDFEKVEGFFGAKKMALGACIFFLLNVPLGLLLFYMEKLTLWNSTEISLLVLYVMVIVFYAVYGSSLRKTKEIVKKDS